MCDGLISPDCVRQTMFRADHISYSLQFVRGYVDVQQHVDSLDTSSCRCIVLINCGSTEALNGMAMVCRPWKMTGCIQNSFSWGNATELTCKLWSSTVIGPTPSRIFISTAVMWRTLRTKISPPQGSSCSTMGSESTKFQQR